MTCPTCGKEKFANGRCHHCARQKKLIAVAERNGGLLATQLALIAEPVVLQRGMWEIVQYVCDDCASVRTMYLYGGREVKTPPA